MDFLSDLSFINSSEPKDEVYNPRKNILIILMVVAGLMFVAAVMLIVAFTSNRSESPQNNLNNLEIPAEGPISITGTIVCLPHTDTTGPQTLECALGLRDEEDRYFSLRDTDPNFSQQQDRLVRVEGEFLEEPSGRYQDVGVIEVSEITLLQQ